MELYTFIVLVVLCIKIVLGDLEEALSHFEPLKSVHVRHRIVKRSLNDEDRESRELEFDILHRHFHLRVTQKRPVVASGFRVTAVDGFGRERDVTPDLKNFYQGYDLSSPTDSSVSLYYDDDDIITASIALKNETYNIEPSWRHIKKPHDYSMIAYKRSDLNMEKDFGQKYCEGIRVDETYLDNYEHHDESLHDQYDPLNVQRMKRQTQSNVLRTPAKNTCPLYLVADYRFYRTMGESNLQKTTSYMINLVDRIDHIYRETVFSSGLIDMGFEVKEIKIHEFPSTVAGGGQHYNEQKMSWDTKELLEVFSRDKDFSNFCLAHLFTHIPFANGVLGLAYIGSPRTYSVGGICSPVYYKGGRQLYLNTGWSSSVNRANRSLLTDEALLVTTHEFGHNWGSEHDPDTPECSPNSFSGGKYIMYTYSVSGYDSNNKVFSNCSKRNMGAVLNSKSPMCFTGRSGSFCGNFRIEQGEQCDAGPRGRDGLDRCCDKFCQFRDNALCSDANHECCWNCGFRSATERCHTAQKDSCEGNQNCSGYSPTCPKPPAKNNGESCLNRGECRDGVCLPFCESQGLESCVCDQVAESCYWCCKEQNGQCKPHQDMHFIPNGTYCIVGICDGLGNCDKQTVDLIERIWQIIENITPSRFVAFMRANIVGTVIVFSLAIWIPVSCVICHLDRKKKKEDEKHRQWMSHSNRSLVHEDNQSRRSVSIRRAVGVREHRSYPNQMLIQRDNMRTEPRSTFI